MPSLRALHASAHEVHAVVTRQDAPLGRKKVLTPSPVARAADELGLPVLKANRLDEEATERIGALWPELGVIVAYGGLIREPLLSTPTHGWINLHFSVLPRWRGAAPVQRAIMAGDPVLGASVFQLVAGLDEGPVFATLERPALPAETAGDALTDLAGRGAALLADVVDAIAAGTARSTQQRGESNYAAKLGIDDARIDWTRSAQEVSQRVRGVTPEPGAFTTIDEERFKILAIGGAHDTVTLAPGAIESRDGAVLVGTGTVALELALVQPAGKRPMEAAAWWRGHAASETVVAR